MPNSICSEAAAAKPVFSPHRQNFRVCFLLRMLGSIPAFYGQLKKGECSEVWERKADLCVAVECDRCGRKEACKTLPRALLLSQIQIQVQIHTQTYTMMTNMVVKTKEACKTLLRAALTAHCKTLPHTDHCTQSQRLHTFPRSCRRHILERLCSQSRKLVAAVKEIKFCLSTGFASITNAARRVNSLCEHYT